MGYYPICVDMAGRPCLVVGGGPVAERRVAGSNGRLAIVWYGTSDLHNPDTTDVHQPWNVYLGMVTHAASSSPTVRQTKVTRHPMHFGTICLAGTGCKLSVMGPASPLLRWT